MNKTPYKSIEPYRFLTILLGLPMLLVYLFMPVGEPTISIQLIILTAQIICFSIALSRRGYNEALQKQIISRNFHNKS